MLTINDLDGRRDGRRLLAIGLLAICVLSVLAVPATAQGPTVTATGGTTAPGETVTVSITVTETETLELSSVPATWNVTEVTGPTGPSNETQVRWAWLTGSGSSETTVSVTFAIPDGTSTGDYVLPVTATADGTTAETNLTVTIADNSPPNPAFTYSPASPEPNETVTFDGSDSVDQDGTITEFAWDFDGDNETDATGEVVNYTFVSAGEYTVSLTVTDDEGASTTTEQTVTVENQSTSEPSNETTVSIQLEAAPNGIQTYNISLSGEGGATITDVTTELLPKSTFDIVAGGAGSQSVTARGADFGGVAPFTEPRTLFTVTFDEAVTESNLSVTVNLLQDDDGTPINSSLVTLSVPEQGPVFESPIGGGEGPPTDPDGDGLFEDVTGDGEVTFGDALALAFVQSGDLTQAQIDALDFDGDGDLDFGDAFELAFQIS